MAEYVRRCGYPMEGDNDEVGAHDDANISLSYRKLLNDPTFPWSNYPIVKPANEVVPLCNLDYEVAKFPFLMMHPTLMKIWISERGTGRDRLLILCREAENVIQSKKNTPRREEIFSTDSEMLKQTPEQLKQNWYDSFMEVLKSGIEFRILKFPEFIHRYGRVYFALHEFGRLDKIPPNPKLWYETVDERKVTAK